MARRVIDLRAACRCGHKIGWIEVKSGQNCVYCMGCNRFQYNAPKTETGEVPREVRTATVKPGIRWKVAERARGRCEVCGTCDTPAFHISHLLSFADGIEAGLTERDLLDIDNLMWLCEECNLGNLHGSVHPVLWLTLLHKRATR